MNFFIRFFKVLRLNAFFNMRQKRIALAALE